MSTILTWIKPTADQIHIWNYFGAVKPMLELQKENKIFFMIADLHALTTVHEKNLIWRSSINQAKIYIASWIDFESGILFRQHKVAQHTELNRVLSCMTGFGQLRRMHAFKDAVASKRQENISAWVFNYPSLMAADILLYDAELVPVWVDQKQHVEHTKDIAQRFNWIYWDVLTIPKELINSNIAKIPWIDWRKMSKSYDNFIWILDDNETILKRTKSVISDSIAMWTPKNPDECTIYNILKHLITEEENWKIRQNYQTWNFSFKNMKELLYEKMISFISPIRKKYKEITDQEVKQILEENERKARDLAFKKIKDIYAAIWF